MKSAPNYSRLFPVTGDKSLYFQPFEHRILNYFLTVYELENKYAHGTILYASDFSFMTLCKKYVLLYNGY